MMGGGYGMGGYGMGGMMGGGYGTGMMGGGYGMGMMGGGMMGGGMYPGASGMGGYGANPYAGSGYNSGQGYGGAVPGFGAMSSGGTGVAGGAQTGVSAIGGVSPNSVTGSTGADTTGSYLGMGAMGMGMMPGSTEFGPRVMPNISDNSLLILATPDQYESLTKLFDQLDVPPRQVLIEAQILEVDLSGSFSAGVEAWLQQLGAANPATIPGSASNAGRTLLGALDPTQTLTLSAGVLVHQSRQLFGALTAQETTGRTKVISTPRIIATDSIPATITVGDQVPTLSSQAVTSATSAGSSLFANTIQNVNTGTTMKITARVNPSGIVTLQIDQQVSSPIPATSSSAIQSPSFSNREVQTQVTVQDGDMIGIGGIIQETKTDSSTGIPFLHNLPYLGVLFGSKTTTTNRTELVIFITPHVIYDMNGMNEASDALINGMKKVQKMVRE
jgi:general secretion pathway protein D